MQATQPTRRQSGDGEGGRGGQRDDGEDTVGAGKRADERHEPDAEQCDEAADDERQEPRDASRERPRGRRVWKLVSGYRGGEPDDARRGHSENPGHRLSLPYRDRERLRVEPGRHPDHDP
ncbi:MAG TPA: hypothetical protein VIL44_07955 [Micromonospora sp.]